MTIPIRATYRLQLSAAFTLDMRARSCPISRGSASRTSTHRQCSARVPGSTHGYDVVDPTRLDPELGSDASWDALITELRAHGMGMVLDIVPNHMGVGADNPFWDDLFANGPASRYASWFDIDWNTPARGLKGRVLIPILGRRARRDDRIPVICSSRSRGGRYRLKYFVQSFPLDPATIPLLLDFAIDALPADVKLEDAAELSKIRDALAALPSRLTARRALIEQRQKSAPELLRRLESLADALARRPCGAEGRRERVHRRRPRATSDSARSSIPRCTRSSSGAAPRTTSTTDASSTSTSSSHCEWRIPPSSARHTGALSSG